MPTCRKKDYHEFTKTTFNYERTSDIYECQKLCDRYHAAMGLAGEWLELINDLRQPARDETAIIKELGDCCYYLAMLENLFGILTPIPIAIEGYKTYEVDAVLRDGNIIIEKLLDTIKKKIAYKLDNQDVRDPIADCKMFLCKIAMQFGLSYETVQARNMEKLALRYKNGFTREEAALKRDATVGYSSF